MLQQKFQLFRPIGFNEELYEGRSFFIYIILCKKKLTHIVANLTPENHDLNNLILVPSISRDHNLNILSSTLLAYASTQLRFEKKRLNDTF